MAITPSNIHPDDVAAIAATIDPDILAAAIAATAERRNVERVEHDVAAAAVTAELTSLSERLASLRAGAVAAGITVADPVAIVHAAVDRVGPAAPEHVAAIIAPAPAPAAPAPVAAGSERTRRNPVRSLPAAYDGSYWAVKLTGRIDGGPIATHRGRVRANIAADGTATFTATTGNRGTYDTPTRAAQSACGDPTTDAPSVAGRGRSAATVNGWRGCILVRNAGAAADDVANGPRMMAVAVERADD